MLLMFSLFSSETGLRDLVIKNKVLPPRVNFGGKRCWREGHGNKNTFRKAPTARSRNRYHIQTGVCMCLETRSDPRTQQSLFQWWLWIAYHNTTGCSAYYVVGSLEWLVCICSGKWLVSVQAQYSCFCWISC